MTCTHEEFFASVLVNKISDMPGLFHVDMSVKCSICSAQLEFKGLDVGISFEEPTVNALGTEVRLPATIAGNTPLFLRKAGMKEETAS